MQDVAGIASSIFQAQIGDFTHGKDSALPRSCFNLLGFEILTLWGKVWIKTTPKLYVIGLNLNEFLDFSGKKHRNLTFGHGTIASEEASNTKTHQIPTFVSKTIGKP